MGILAWPLLAATVLPSPLRAEVNAALIQLKGEPLAGGRFSGSARVPLERAAGGDTPVLTFASPQGVVRLLLDTGASSSMVTPDLAERLGLASTALPPDSFELAGAGSGCGSLRPRRTVLPPLGLGDSAAGPGRLELTGAEALLMPVGALPAGVDGVLGAPSLRRLPVRIDPLQNQVSLGNAALSVQGTRPRLRVPLRWHKGVPLLDLTTVAGSVPALADTGAEGLFLSPGLAGKLHPFGRPRSLRLVGFCGEQTVQRQPFAGLVLPGETLPGTNPGEAVVPREGIVTDNPIFRQLGVGAIVGQELLRHRPQLWRLDRDPPLLELW